MILCAQCGVENRETARFCMNCGAELKAPVPEPATDDQSDVTTDAALSPENPAEEPEAVDLPEAPEPATEEEPAVAPDVEPDQADTNIEGEPAEAEPITEVQEPTPPQDAIEPEETPEPVSPPLEPGAILDGRYEIVTLLEEDPETLLYDALDRGRCTQCGYADSQPGDVFCANCGASLVDVDEPPHVHLRALRIAGEAIIQLEEESEGRIERWLEADGRLYAVLATPLPPAEPKDESAPFGRGVRHIVGYNSDAGLQRELDEDAMLALTLGPMFESQSSPSLGLYAVADGMGGHASGEVASRLAIEGLAETIVKRLFLSELAGEPILPETPPAMLEEAIHLVNTRIYQSQQATGSDMGTTLTAAMVRDDLALIANVGDSRTYLWRDGRLTQITTDHSLVAQLVAAGAIEPDEIYTHPDKSAIYRSLGHTQEVEVDLFTQPLQPGDRLLLCCDGVWEMLRDEGIEEVLLLEADPQRACDEIVRRSNLAGGEDNISVMIVLFEGLV